ncbi:bifunctional hydroxymethylpyrimidine kinase/phosphomethylpyrimidine kinase [Rickettsiella massiliensis]|uniref:bifunctional hydroxymethylpyrimidine kinase/phosphomethylpyrimidine kinase n=1 Tax=Rickettsiella massiliensis TaxID=676517 RepID=UPI00029AAF48|nr:bifunctional hydroxymethylpyrimidine kinase/phosphomethylpyrimidine kinase [Rickettsiella massiliensis]
MLTLSSHPPVVVTLAGTDPSGGAGIQADIKAISATGSYAASIITVLVAQNTQGVSTIEEISLPFLQQQIDAVFSDLEVAAIKIGMLYKKINY